MTIVKAKNARDMLNFIKNKPDERGEFISIFKITLDNFADELHDLKRVEEIISNHIYTACPHADAVYKIQPNYAKDVPTGFDIELYAIPKQEKPDAIIEVIF